jgi:hypothetical protein
VSALAGGLRQRRLDGRYRQCMHRQAGANDAVPKSDGALTGAS